MTAIARKEGTDFAAKNSISMGIDGTFPEEVFTYCKIEGKANKIARDVERLKGSLFEGKNKLGSEMRVAAKLASTTAAQIKNDYMGQNNISPGSGKMHRIIKEKVKVSQRSEIRDGRAVSVIKYVIKNKDVATEHEYYFMPYGEHTFAERQKRYDEAQDKRSYVATTSTDAENYYYVGNGKYEGARVVEFRLQNSQAIMDASLKQMRSIMSIAGKILNKETLNPKDQTSLSQALKNIEKIAAIWDRIYDYPVNETPMDYMTLWTGGMPKTKSGKPFVKLTEAEKLQMKKEIEAML